MKRLKTDKFELTKQAVFHLTGPNGIGKTTFLEKIFKREIEGVEVHPRSKIGYYRQDFHNLDENLTVIQCLENASHGAHSNQDIRKIASSLLIKGDIVKQKILTLSEGQKGLVSFICLILEQPAILLLDEPTNHINFRHLPAIAEAINNFKGGVLIVSHDQEFMNLIKVDREIDLNFEMSD